ncbi:cupin domain-containing protein [Marinomonas piezotolerans]|uniref:Cupin domain-containing protein n=1 Tax=Marinomonas piezotolerans TaxID=2213058 RepID=A0A370U5M2_9GAMM|nr:cupin domain-containing protein [Marinomonas piezotolerans]RDL43061.1 cupin domain-containing protein [Marinomonas piezotolerans]
MMNIDTPISILAGMSLRTFITEYWQKKPLLIRGGAKDIDLPITADELAGLAMEEEVESRIVMEHGDTPWQLLQGPFSEEDFAQLPEKDWTLLVQACDHWVPEVQALRERFNFLPSWRVDDIMISYATEGGSVGPHYDQYDVFLIQMAGQRRWQVLAPEQFTDTPLNDVSLHILDQFDVDPEQDWVLEPGDILYLPPNFAHNGRSLDNDCMTFSVGFRAPSVQAALRGLSDKLCEDVDEKNRFAAPEPIEREHHAQILPSDIEHLKQKITALLDNPELLANWLGETMSEAKYPEYTAQLNDDELNDCFSQALKGDTFIRPGDARICYYTSEGSPSTTLLYCNGAKMTIDATLVPFVEAICDQEEFDFSALDLTQHSELPDLLRFLLQHQAIVALPDEEEE